MNSNRKRSAAAEHLLVPGSSPDPRLALGAASTVSLANAAKAVVMHQADACTEFECV